MSSSLSTLGVGAYAVVGAVTTVAWGGVLIAMVIYWLG
jgi:hypothetical protein